MAHVHLVLGPVGAGKSTYVRTLVREHRAVALILDDWMTRLYGADERPATGVIEWYIERRDRCVEQIWAVARSLLAVDVDVILELGLIRRDDRALFFRKLDAVGCGLTIHVLDATRECRRERVRRRNLERGETFAMEVPDHVFEMASDMWQQLDDDECRGRDVRLLP
jgi:predicted kinase